MQSFWKFFTSLGVLKRDYGYISRLESLRGLAALVVAIHHSLLVLLVPVSSGHLGDIEALGVGTQAWLGAILQQIFNGNAVVTLFFVHSGLVLGLSLDKRGESFPLRTLNFWIRRFFRLYPMQIFTTLCIATGVVFVLPFRHVVHATPWFEGFYQHSIGLRDIIENCFLIRYDMSGVTWSLCVELLASLLIPFLHCVSRKANRMCDLVVLSLLIYLAQHPVSGLVDGYFEKALISFYLGLVIPAWAPLLFEKLPPRLLASLMIPAMGLMLGAYNFEAWMSPILLEALMATYIVAGIVYLNTNRLLHFLDGLIPTFYGRVCYSFYLWHFIILYALSVILLPILPSSLIALWPLPVSLVLALISITGATAVSHFSHTYIELPFIGFGKQITGMLGERSKPLAPDKRYASGDSDKAA